MSNCQNSVKRLKSSGTNSYVRELQSQLMRARLRVRVLTRNFARNWTACFKRQMNHNYGSNCCVMTVAFKANKSRVSITKPVN